MDFLNYDIPVFYDPDFYKNKHQDSYFHVLEQIKYLVPIVIDVKKRNKAAIKIQSNYRGFSRRNFNKYIYPTPPQIVPKSIERTIYDLQKSNKILYKKVRMLYSKCNDLDSEVDELRFELTNSMDQIEELEDELTLVYDKLHEIEYYSNN